MKIYCHYNKFSLSSNINVALLMMWIDTIKHDINVELILKEHVDNESLSIIKDTYCVVTIDEIFDNENIHKNEIINVISDDKDYIKKYHDYLSPNGSHSILKILSVPNKLYNREYMEFYYGISKKLSKITPDNIYTLIKEYNIYYDHIIEDGRVIYNHMDIKAKELEKIAFKLHIDEIENNKIIKTYEFLCINSKIDNPIHFNKNNRYDGLISIFYNYNNKEWDYELFHYDNFYSIEYSDILKAIKEKWNNILKN